MAKKLELDWLKISIRRRRPTNAEVWPRQGRLKELIEKEAELHEKLRESCSPIGAMGHDYPQAHSLWRASGGIFLSDSALEFRRQFGNYLKGNELHEPISEREVRKLSGEFQKLPAVIKKAQSFLVKSKFGGTRHSEMFTNLANALARVENYRSHLLLIADELRAIGKKR
ncbi:hypothetical protein HY095_04650 [Candidatus Micrarchaeota archaeon]|nr:hypothetical protein [Candidatus Micrarchaeota archaeon]